MTDFQLTTTPRLSLVFGLALLVGLGQASASPGEEDSRIERSVPDLPEVDEIDGEPVYHLLPADAIEAIDDPTIVAASGQHGVADDDPVLGVVVDGEARAYPLQVLHRAEIVNDQLAGRAIAATW